ncbi:MAG: endolytic transglycosylase MltG [Pseudomonadota bacterium]|nr:endolytic transglycosylase MltG [Pseudomonadota bacterium]MEC8977339.1 endolytic transglycosylase MltG [Pseudomonadota bacterium]
MSISSYVKKFSRFLVCILIFTTSYFGFLYYEVFIKPLHSFSMPAEFRIKKGETIRSVGLRMQHATYLRSSDLFWMSFLSLLDENKLYSGNYIIKPGDTLYDFIRRVGRAEVLSESITIIEGWTWEKLWKHLGQDNRIRHSHEKDVHKYFLSASKMHESIASLEGFFLPDTYHFAAGVRDIDILAHAYTASRQFLEKEWSLRDDNLLFTKPYEAIVMASLIERESSFQPELSHISAVIHNRLRLNMPIQIDASVLYGRGSHIKGPLTIKDLRRDGPYNTYRRKGLPITPISMPSRKAIIAALHPMKTDDLYYLAMPNGRHYFSKTFASHKRAKRYYRKKK